MSATINANDLKFTIFGSGHDYTLADSGEGEKVFFSHPYVPKGSVNYAGQYLFYCPIFDDQDETVEPVITDVVKDDIAHCTFDPAIGTTFNTEGEVTIKVHYYREYIYAESTVIVEKELEQVIEVVDHGNILIQSASVPWSEVYDDGYVFMHPRTTSGVTYDFMSVGFQDSRIKKLSNIPWRVNSLGYENTSAGGFCSGCANLTDISELETADTSNVTEIYRLFQSCVGITDYSALEKWDVGKCQYMVGILSYSATLDDLSFLSGWNTGSLLTLYATFQGVNTKSLKGLENWDVSKVTDLHSCFDTCQKLEDISALFNWDVSNVTNMNSLFNNCTKLLNLHGIEAWDISKVTDIQWAFNACTTLTTFAGLGYWRIHPTVIEGAFAGCTNVQNLNGLEGFDVSGCTSFNQVFANDNRLLSLEGIKDWDVSNVTNFYRMFWRCYWVENLDDIKDWDMSSALSCEQMFQETADICEVNNVVWDLSSATNLKNMFNSYYMCYSSSLDKKVYKVGQYYYDYEGNQYANLSVTIYTKDASNAENWDVVGTNKQAFNGLWSNLPSWN